MSLSVSLCLSGVAVTVISLFVLRMIMVMRIFHCYFIVYCYILEVHKLIDWPSLVYSPRHCETGVKCKSYAQFMCLVINHFVTVTIMYYSNLQVNYMVTVFIR